MVTVGRFNKDVEGECGEGLCNMWGLWDGWGLHGEVSVLHPTKSAIKSTAVYCTSAFVQMMFAETDGT